MVFCLWKNSIEEFSVAIIKTTIFSLLYVYSQLQFSSVNRLATKDTFRDFAVIKSMSTDLEGGDGVMCECMEKKNLYTKTWTVIYYNIIMYYIM